MAKAGFDNDVDALLDHHMPSKEEEGRLLALMDAFALTQQEVSGSIERMKKSAILRDLDAGIITPINVEGLPIILLKGEAVLWLFNNTALHELKRHSAYVGGSQGVSIRIARGVYYRVGEFKGHHVETEQLEQQDVGTFVVTNKNIYFSGPSKSFRIHLQKIVSVRGYSDGLSVARESANPKPLVFMLDDPWFATNLILKVEAMSQ